MIAPAGTCAGMRALFAQEELVRTGGITSPYAGENEVVLTDIRSADGRAKGGGHPRYCRHVSLNSRATSIYNVQQ